METSRAAFLCNIPHPPQFWVCSKRQPLRRQELMLWSVLRGHGQIVADLSGANTPISQSCTDTRADLLSSNTTASRPPSGSVSAKAAPKGVLTAQGKSEVCAHLHMPVYMYVHTFCVTQACAHMIHTSPVGKLVHMPVLVSMHMPMCMSCQKGLDRRCRCTCACASP